MMLDVKVMAKFDRLRWHMITYMTIVHIAAFAGIFYISQCKWQSLLWAVGMFAWTGTSITGGLHRLWAHKSYKAHWLLRIYYMIGTSIANQGSIYLWVKDHRIHHKFSETDADPHNVRQRC